MIKNSKQHYGWPSQLMHWSMAIIFIGLYVLGTWMVDLDYYDEWYHRAPDIHKSIGILIVIMMLFRLIWNKVQSRPVDSNVTPIQHKLAHILHNFFYLIVFALFISGYLISTAKGKPIDVFGWFEVPALLSENSERGDLAGLIHEYIGLVFIILAALHAAAALYHHYYLKDSVLTRMIRFNFN